MQVLFLEAHSLVSVLLSTRVEGSETLAPRKPFLSSKYVRALLQRRSRKPLLCDWVLHHWSLEPLSF